MSDARDPLVAPAAAPDEEHVAGPAGEAAAAPGTGSAPGQRSRAVRRLWRAGRGRVSRWWADVPLGARLVGITTVLLGVGLLVAGLVAGALLGRTLVAQVDEKLQDEGQALADDLVNGDGLEGRGTNQRAPSDYYVQISASGSDPQQWASRSVVAAYGLPTVPTLTDAQVAEQAGEPFTVGSTVRGARWRMVVLPVADRFSGQVVGSVAIALPLGGAQDTVHDMVVVLVLSGAAILLVGMVAGGWAVRRSLRPLREIETTAEAIAAGDLSQRVPPAPPHTEVGRLSAALNAMLTQIEQAFAVQAASEARMRRFVSDASHELRTPLAAVRGYGELYRMGALTTTEQVDDTMRRIEDSARRMGVLVEDLLSLARLDEGRPLDRAAVDLTVLAADAVADLHALDPGRPARVEPLQAGGGVGPFLVDGDEARLRQVLANLVGNVVQHTPAGTPVEVAVGASGGRGVVEVRDHGPGIEPEHAARVFERFYRVDASRGRAAGGGAGLGMAIVAAIVEAHGGAVGITRTPGGGTTVRVEVPSWQDAAAGDEPGTDAAPVTYDGASSSSS